ncbi:(2Fe-2S)-binding protein [Marinobacterium sp. YM272]|uniref:(2Fe-2S)-binding protein n=1 Tax=Marinobacterium sp. YM272 TaxID=3421654 RepID=UPI003D7F8DA8
MYVCICNNITEREVQQAIDDGASSVRDLNRSLSVGSECGKCTCTARQILKREQAERALALAVPA